jgi:hypothetical protein
MRVLNAYSFNLLGWQFDKGNIRLFHCILTSSFFCFNGQFFEQMDEDAMGSLLSLVTARFFMQYNEKVALSWATYKLTCWFHVNDTFMI